MSVVQKDPIVEGMLLDERNRCIKAIGVLSDRLSDFPKGSIHIRKVSGEKKQYSYYFLKYRDGDKSVFKHIPAAEVAPVKEQIEYRKKIQAEIAQNKSRVKYLDKLLARGGSKLD